MTLDLNEFQKRVREDLGSSNFCQDIPNSISNEEVSNVAGLSNMQITLLKVSIRRLMQQDKGEDYSVEKVQVDELETKPHCKAL